MTVWPELPYAAWSDTLDTLHMVLQILGKVRVALSPKEPEWAHITLYVSARGHHHRAGAVAVGLLEVEVDFLDHEVVVRTSAGEAGRRRRCATVRSPSSGASSSRALRAVGIDAELSPTAAGGARPDPVPRRHDAPHLRRRGGHAVLAGADDRSSRCSRSTAPRSRARCRASSSSGGVPTSPSRASRASRARRRRCRLLERGRTTTSR